MSNRTIGSGKGWVIFVNSCDLQNDEDIDILNFGSGELAWRIWVNVNNDEANFLNVPLPNIYLYKDGMHNGELAVLEGFMKFLAYHKRFTFQNKHTIQTQNIKVMLLLFARY